jgi:hypothetical protein
MEKCPSCKQDQPIKVTVNMHPTVLESLKWIAQAKGITAGEALSQCVSLYQWALKARMNGSRILLETRGRIREVLDF